MAQKKNKSASSELSQDSLEFLGLSKQPFAAEILSENTFFKSQALDKIVENLTHQIQFSDLLLIVEGQQGSGKTSLFRYFIQQDIANTKILSVQAEATDTLIELQHKISLHLEDLGDANHLDDNLKSLQTFDQIPVLTMDSSHVLSDTTLQELFRYQHQLSQEQGVTLKILLFSNSGMSATLQKITDIQPDQMYVQSLPTYSPKQVENFLFHKLRHAGYTGEPLFDEKRLQQLFKKATPSLQGYMNAAAPAIDRIVERKLKPGSSVWIKLFSALLIITLIAAAGIAYFFYSNKDSLTTEAQPPAESITTPAPLFIEDETTQDTAAEADSVAVDAAPAPILQEAVPAATPDLPLNNSEITATDVIPQDVTTTIDEQQAAVSSQALQTSAADLQAASPDITRPAITKPAATKPVITEPATIKTTAAPTPQVAPAAKVQPPEPSVNSTAINTKTEAGSMHPAFKQLQIMGIKNTDWIKQQPASHYTLQLIGARDPETLLKFARRYQPGNNTAWYKTWLKSRPYYVLIHGSFADRDRARNAISTLSPGLRAIKPWVKSMSAVQQSIK